jgi:hypothetical protein
MNEKQWWNTAVTFGDTLIIFFVRRGHKENRIEVYFPMNRRFYFKTVFKTNQ